tara:strand:+ start:461 stop:829 length:369 start_codon:yes stop_codon:yes gene_type:complete
MNWEDIIKVGYIPSDARKRSAPTINWLDAFDKFGFDDGAENTGQTEEIAEFLRKNGYLAHLVEAGGHNTYISAVIEKGEGIAYPKDGIKFRRSPDREYFKSELLKLLDGKYGKSMKSEHIKS